MEETTRPRDAVGAATIAEAFRITSANRTDEVAVRTKGDEVSWTWGELRDRVDALAGGLAALGLRRGETVALLLANRPEFHLCDLAAMTAGATPFSIYVQYTPEQIRFVVSDAAARILITEQQLLGGVLEARKELPELEHVIVVDGEAPAGVLSLDEVAAADADFDADDSVARIVPDDLLTLIYTSGTTGPPKGVQLAHRNMLATVAAIEELIEFPRDGRVIS
jgi:long-chain acyl-CoA synthetase